MRLSELAAQLIAPKIEEAIGGGPPEIPWNPNDGRWVTLNGKHIFIPNGVAMRDPGGPKPGRDKWNTKGKDGKVGPTVYSERFNDRRAKYKYAKAYNLAKMADRVGRSLRSECSRKTIDEKKATATACLIMHLTGMRVGGDGQSYAKKGDIELGVKGPPRNEDGTPVKGPDGKPIKGDQVTTYGATTMPKKHVKVSGDVVQFHYMGKSGIPRRVRVEDQALANAVRDFLGGDESDSDEPLFGDLTSSSRTMKRTKKFNKNFLNKDYRTAVAMSVAADEAKRIISSPPRLDSFIDDKDQGKPMTPARLLRAQTNMAKDVILRIATAASNQLGNDPKMAQKSYISPEIFEYTLEQIGLSETLKASKPIKQKNREPVMRSRVLPTKYVESKEWKPPVSDAAIDSLAIGLHAIDERGDTIKAKMPVLVRLFGVDIVRGLVDEFLSDGDTPRGGLQKLIDKEV